MEKLPKNTKEAKRVWWVQNYGKGGSQRQRRLDYRRKYEVAYRNNNRTRLSFNAAKSQYKKKYGQGDDYMIHLLWFLERNNYPDHYSELV